MLYVCIYEPYWFRNPYDVNTTVPTCLNGSIMFELAKLLARVHHMSQSKVPYGTFSLVII